MRGAPRGESAADAALLPRRAGQQAGPAPRCWRPTSSRVASLAKSTSLVQSEPTPAFVFARVRAADGARGGLCPKWTVSPAARWWPVWWPCRRPTTTPVGAGGLARRSAARCSCLLRVARNGRGCGSPSASPLAGLLSRGAAGCAWSPDGIDETSARFRPAPDLTAQLALWERRRRRLRVAGIRARPGLILICVDSSTAENMIGDLGRSWSGRGRT
jgi:hypothetical protein